MKDPIKTGECADPLRQLTNYIFFGYDTHECLHVSEAEYIRWFFRKLTTIEKTACNVLITKLQFNKPRYECLKL